MFHFLSKRNNNYYISNFRSFTKSSKITFLKYIFDKKSFSDLKFSVIFCVMKKFFCFASFAVLVFLVNSNVFAQTEKEIAQIRAEVSKINKSPRAYKKETRDVEGISLEGTEATYFVSGKGLKKIAAKMYGETYNASVEIYYSGEEMIFAFMKENRYDTQIGMTPPPKVVRSEERRFYFSGGNLIQMLNGKKEMKTADEKYDEYKQQIEEIAEKLKADYLNSKLQSKVKGV